MRGKASNSRKGDTPGPGAYSANGETSGAGNPSKFSRSPNYGFGGASRDGIRPQSSPGPGQYQPRSPINSTKYGFGTSERVGVRSRPDQPGPASYRVEGKMGNEGPKYSNGPRRNNSSLSGTTPGPGAYHPDTSSTSTFSGTKKFGFGTSPREGRSMVANPGPGAYDSKTSVDKGPKYSFPARADPQLREMTPGPGEYTATYTMFG